MSTRLKALAEYDIDPAVLVRAQERRVFGRPLFGRTDSMLLRPEAEVRLPLAG
jgi:hypothetical protein